MLGNCHNPHNQTVYTTQCCVDNVIGLEPPSTTKISDQKAQIEFTYGGSTQSGIGLNYDLHSPSSVFKNGIPSK